MVPNATSTAASWLRLRSVAQSIQRDAAKRNVRIVFSSSVPLETVIQAVVSPAFRKADIVAAAPSVATPPIGAQGEALAVHRAREARKSAEAFALADPSNMLIAFGTSEAVVEADGWCTVFVALVDPADRVIVVRGPSVKSEFEKSFDALDAVRMAVQTAWAQLLLNEAAA